MVKKELENVRVCDWPIKERARECETGKERARKCENM
jgi:hypothetical protein